MYSNTFRDNTLRSQLTVKDTKDCILIYQTSEGTGIIDFTLEMVFDGNEMLINHLINLESIKVVNMSLEKIVLTKVKRTHNILLISDIRTGKRIEKMMDGRLLSSQKLVTLAPKSDWFTPENNKLVAMLGDLSTNSDKIDELLQDEYPTRIPTQEKPKISAYLRAKGTQWRALIALANSLPFFINRLRNKGVNDNILSKRFHWA